MEAVIAWFIANSGVLTAILGALLTLASLITGLTSTPKDDEWVRKIASFLSFLQPSDAEGTVKPPLTSPGALIEARPASDDGAGPGFKQL